MLRVKLRKVKIGMLLWKTLIYRIIVTFTQIVVTYFFTKNMELSISLSIVWNIINTVEYFVLDYAFLRRFKIQN